MPAPRDSCCGLSIPIAKPAKDPRGAHDAKAGLSWERVEQFPAMPTFLHDAETVRADWRIF